MLAMTEEEFSPGFQRLGVQLGGYHQQADGPASVKVRTRFLVPEGDSSLVLKPYQELEFRFYDETCPSPLRPFIPRHQALRSLPGESTLFMPLQNLTHGMLRPCLVDLKLGTRTCAPDAPEEKVQRQLSRYPQQSGFGFRVVAMQLYEDANETATSFSKDWGNTLQEWDQLVSGFGQVFSRVMSSTQQHYLLDRLEELLEVWKAHLEGKWEMFSSSLFISFDAASDLIEVKLIDFAYFVPKEECAEGVECGVLEGLSNIRKMFVESIEEV